ncbi:uncharacterized protein LOC122320871 [Drosophila ficusphila]|uniref:uncharacterized protein LOC122320871 n=1 Tax=Drosophila ficusphila TaxID=30025 RepID=UPI001C8AB595|nr:uncharacterized protein LOC122320871 [Drosophila ficusphila]
MSKQHISTHKSNKGSALCEKLRRKPIIQKPKFVLPKSFENLSPKERDQVYSALESAAKLGESSRKKQQIEKETQKKLPSIVRKDSKSEKEPQKSIQNVRKNHKLKPCHVSFELEEPSDGESEKEMLSRPYGNGNSELFTITIDKRYHRRMRTALKLLDYVEGKASESDSDWSMAGADAGGVWGVRTPPKSQFFDRTPQNFFCVRPWSMGSVKSSSANLVRSGNRKKRGSSLIDSFGYCRDCRMRCRSCGRRASAMAFSKNKK